MSPRKKKPIMGPEDKFIRLFLGQAVNIATGPGKVVGRTVIQGGVCKVLVQSLQIDPVTGMGLVWSLNVEEICYVETK